jgi:flagellar basal body-associated protein FliL
VSKKKRSAAASRRRPPQKKSNSLAIPLLVGVVLVAVVAAVIVSFENRGAAPRPASLPTAGSLSTASIPYPGVPRTSLQDAQQGVAAGEALFLDVRSAAAYQQSHIAGAISAPETELEEWIDELPQDVDLVLY